MAAVQLKDLMDPLVKIQQSTNRTADSVDNLIKVVTGAATVADSLNLAILTELQLHTQLLKNMSGGSGLTSLFSSKPGGKSSLGESGDALKLLGAGASEMAKALILFRFVPKKAVVTFQTFIVDLFKTLTKYDQKEIKTGASNLMLLGDAIMNFSKSLALSAVLLIPGLFAIPILIVAVGIMSGLMWMIGMQSKNIKKGADTLDRIGDAIKSFAIGLAFFAVTTFFILMEPKILIGMVASLLLIGGAVGVLGLVNSTIKKGSVALMMMGVGLGLFSVGYGIFALVSSFVTIEDIGKQALILGGIGLTTAALGMFFSNIALGSIAMTLIGIGLTVFSIGYGIFNLASKGVTAEDALKQAAIIGSIGGAFALIGIPFVALAVVLGAVAMAVAGLSLIPLSLGLKTFQMIKWKESDSESLTTALAGIRLAFVGGKTEGGFFASIGGAFTGVLDAGVMIASAAGYAAAGLSLISLSSGLNRWKGIQWTNTDSEQLGIALGTITAAFAQAGGEPSNPGGLFGAVFGTAFSPNATKRGIDSVMGAGKALTEITTGLISFQRLIDSQIDFAVLESSITKTVGFIQTAFSAVAGEGNVAGGGFFGSLFNIQRNKVEEGIRAVQGAGEALTDITTGLVSFQKLIDSQVDFTVLESSITKTVGFVQSAFAAVASEGNVAGGGFFGSLFGIQRNKVEEGVRAVQGAGKELSDIATGLISFNTLAKTSIPFGDPAAPVAGTLAYAVMNTLGFVRHAFAVIGGAEAEDSTFFGLIKWDENLVAKGISAVKGAGTQLTNIATGLLNFSKIKSPDAIASTIKSLLLSMSGTFSSFYDKPEFSTRVTNFSNFVTSIANRGADGSLMKAASGFQKIADAINSVNIDKATAFKGLFEASAALTEKNRDLSALQTLVAAIEEIRDVIITQGTAAATSAIQAPVIATPGFKAAPGQDMSQTLSQLRVTLSQINVTLSNLPADIAAIEIKLPKD